MYKPFKFALWVIIFLNTLCLVRLGYADQSFELFKIQNNIAKDVQLKKDFLICPAQIAPKTAVDFTFTQADVDQCKSNPSQCLQRCQQGSAQACYTIAVELQQRNYYLESEQLFQRSCKLGVASGCTNRAAGMQHYTADLTPKQRQCISQTFQKSCEWKDPWGCSMYARQLIESDDSKVTLAQALQALENSCLNGDEDPACQDANRTERIIKLMMQPNLGSR